MITKSELQLMLVKCGREGNCNKSLRDVLAGIVSLLPDDTSGPRPLNVVDKPGLAVHNYVQSKSGNIEPHFRSAFQVTYIEDGRITMRGMGDRALPMQLFNKVKVTTANRLYFRPGDFVRCTHPHTPPLYGNVFQVVLVMVDSESLLLRGHGDATFPANMFEQVSVEVVD